MEKAVGSIDKLTDSRRSAGLSSSVSPALPGRLQLVSSLGSGGLPLQEHPQCARDLCVRAHAAGVCVWGGCNTTTGLGVRAAQARDWTVCVAPKGKGGKEEEEGGC